MLPNLLQREQLQDIVWSRSTVASYFTAPQWQPPPGLHRHLKISSIAAGSRCAAGPIENARNACSGRTASAQPSAWNTPGRSRVFAAAPPLIGREVKLPPQFGQTCFSTVSTQSAERALEGADHRVGGVRRQILVAAFGIRGAIRAFRPPDHRIPATGAHLSLCRGKLAILQVGDGAALSISAVACRA